VTTPPTIATVTPSVSALWPPDPRMVSETILVSVSDHVDPAPACKIEDVTSNEPIGAGIDWATMGDLFE